MSSCLGKPPAGDVRPLVEELQAAVRGGAAQEARARQGLLPHARGSRQDHLGQESR